MYYSDPEMINTISMIRKQLYPDKVYNIYRGLSNGVIELDEYMYKNDINKIFINKWFSHFANAMTPYINDNDMTNNMYKDDILCHTILSYSFKKKNMNMRLVKTLILYNADINIQFCDYKSPLFYLFKYQDLDKIKEVLNYSGITNEGGVNMKKINEIETRGQFEERCNEIRRIRYDIRAEKVSSLSDDELQDKVYNSFNFYYILHTLVSDNKYDVWSYLTKNRYDIMLSNYTINMFCNCFPNLNWLLKDCIEIYYTMILMSNSKSNNIFTGLPLEIVRKIYKNIFICT